MSGAYIAAGDDGPALEADGVTINGGAYFDDGFTSNGQIQLLDAKIQGLSMSGAHLAAGDDGLALHADRATIEGDTYLDHGFTANGQIKLLVQRSTACCLCLAPI